jgi:hypothetical protein
VSKNRITVFNCKYRWISKYDVSGNWKAKIAKVLQAGKSPHNVKTDITVAYESRMAAKY